MTFLPDDAIAAVVLNFKRAAATEVGRALVEGEFFPAPWKAKHFNPLEVERIIYALGVPTDTSENDCTILQFTRNVDRNALLKQVFGPLEFVEKKWNGATYYRTRSDDEPQIPAAAPAVPGQIPAGQDIVLARYPEDFQANSNGHSDSSDRGNWFYYSSETASPIVAGAGLRKLNWVPAKKRYESPRGARGNEYPTIGVSLDPSPQSPRYAVLRWESRTQCEARVHGNFRKYSNARNGDGVRALILIDGKQVFAADLRFNDTKGADFAVQAPIQPGSVVDFVIDPRGNSSYDSTHLTTTISSVAADGDPRAPRREPIVGHDGVAATTLTAVHFPDDRTLVRTDERRLRRLLEREPAGTPLLKKLAQTDLNHDGVLVLAIRGVEDQVRQFLSFAGEDLPPHAHQSLDRLLQQADAVTARFNLSGKSLLNVKVDVADAAAAGRVTALLDERMDNLEGLRNQIPPQSPLLSLLKQVVQGTDIQSGPTQVSVDVKMPDQLAEFVRRDAMRAVRDLAGSTGRPGRNPFRGDAAERQPVPRDRPAGQPGVGLPRDVDAEGIKRLPPFDLNPDFVDFPVAAYNCRVYLPGAPKLKQQTIKTPRGEVTTLTYTVMYQDIEFVFEIVDFPDGHVRQTGPDAVISQSRATLLAEGNGKLIDSRMLKYQFASLTNEFRCELPKRDPGTVGWNRLVLAGDRLFRMSVTGVDIPLAYADILFNSLEPVDFATDLGTTLDRPAVRERPPAAEPQRKRPVEKDRIAALALVRQVYERRLNEAKSAAQKRELAELVFREAAGIQAPAQKFAALEFARTIAVSVPDVRLSLQIVDALAAEFEADSAFLVETLRELGRSRIDRRERLPWVDRSLQSAERAVLDGQFDIGLELFTQAQSVARQASQPDLVRLIADRVREVRAIVAENTALETARNALAADPTDPGASLSVGQFQCFQQGDWEEGLRLLAQSGDGRLKELARSDRAGAPTSAGQIAIGDQWWGLAADYEGLARQRIQARAAHWYRMARPEAQDLDLKKIELRLSETTPVGIGCPPINLLKLIQPDEDALHGKWTMSRGTLLSPEDSAARILIPYVPPPAYDLTLIVERKTRENQFALGLTVDGVLTMVLFDYQRSTRTAFFSSPQVGYSNAVFPPDTPVTVVVSVRPGLVTVTANGAEILKWTGDRKLVPLRDPDWNVPEGTALFLGASSSVFQIRQFQLIPRP